MSGNAQLLLEVVIVNYNTYSLLKNCLSSLYQSIKNEGLKNVVKITVVDNASSDGSPQMVKQFFPQVNLLENKKNVGFAYANNQAIKKSQAEFIFLLNSDTQVLPNCLSHLLNEIKKDESNAVVGPKLLNGDLSLQPSYGYFPTIVKILFWMLFIDDIPYLSSFLNPYHAKAPVVSEKRQTVDWVSGAALLVRRKILDKVGFLDENIFMYGEEVEWCYRIKILGCQVIYTPYAQLIHLKGGSGKGKDSGIVEEYLTLIYIYQKHFPNLVFSVRFLLKLGALLRIFLFGIIGRQKTKVKLYAKAYAVA